MIKFVNYVFYISLFSLGIFSFAQNNSFPTSGSNQTAIINGINPTLGKLNFINGASMTMEDYSKIQFPGIGNYIIGNSLYIQAHDFRTDQIWMRDAIVEFDISGVLNNDYGGLKFGYQAAKNKTTNSLNSFNSIAGIGFYKIASPQSNRLYLTHGTTPWESTLGINVLPNGNTGIGTLDPSTRLHIVTGTSNDSGLRLANLTSSNSPTIGAAPIGVDATGKVVRVDGGSTSGGWLLTGNPTTNPANHFVGTTDEQPLVFRTNNIERLRITTSGRLIFHGTNVTPNNTNNLYIGGGNDNVPGATNYSNTAIGMASLSLVNNSGYRNTALGSNALRLVTSGRNNVGLGFSAGSNLTTGSSNIIIGNLVNAPISATVSNQLNIGNWIYGYNGQIAIGNFTNISQVFSNITNVGYQLIVKNGIKTEKVRVELASANNWADYVFNADYDLMPIQDLENFISKNKHLPNIPTAEEVMRDGIDLGEMNGKLLEKIEELTLYSIDLYKENVDLAKETQSLQKENQEQQILLEELLKRVEHLESNK